MHCYWQADARDRWAFPACRTCLTSASFPHNDRKIKQFSYWPPWRQKKSSPVSRLTNGRFSTDEPDFQVWLVRLFLGQPTPGKIIFDFFYFSAPGPDLKSVSSLPLLSIYFLTNGTKTTQANYSATEDSPIHTRKPHHIPFSEILPASLRRKPPSITPNESSPRAPHKPPLAPSEDLAAKTKGSHKYR
jgi:hypothetical protein